MKVAHLYLFAIHVGRNVLRLLHLSESFFKICAII